MIEERLAAARPLTGALLVLHYLRLDRDRPPRPAQNQLVREPGPMIGVGHWPTWSPATGPSHLRLEELPAG